MLNFIVASFIAMVIIVYLTVDLCGKFDTAVS